MISYALYIIGNCLKKSKRISGEKIPCILGSLGSLCCVVYILVTEKFDDSKMIILGVLTGTIRGICAAGMSVYIHQIIKQTILDNKTYLKWLYDQETFKAGI